ncbi:MAG: class II aldolase/adducin family protein [Candidatus Magnetomorum sp.]|nr:class II aldolase/adducin family protein [Candidatus Magnetomorum sp.]
MNQLIQKYAQKLYTSGLVCLDEALIGALDDECVWNQSHDRLSDLTAILSALPVNALIFATPKAPYDTVIKSLAQTNTTVICPQDTETRTFLHELPIVRRWDRSQLINALSRRKAVIIPGEGIIATGALTPEQAFVVFSSVCFACFVAYFSEIFQKAVHGKVKHQEMDAFVAMMDTYPKQPDHLPALKKGPFVSEASVHEAIIDAGYHTVAYGLVDSYFGNVSYRFKDTLYISQTASSLDELAACIDPCPLDGSSCAAITASSEFSAHKHIVSERNIQAVLHGHPKFSVIMSMICADRDHCKNNGRCHTHCSTHRSIDGIPIVCGEVGCGPYGLAHTLPEAFRNNDAAIVYGHGVFTLGEIDFISAFCRLAETEKKCQDVYFQHLKAMI